MICLGKRANRLMPALANAYITLYLIFLIYAKKDVSAYARHIFVNILIMLSFCAP